MSPQNLIIVSAGKFAREVYTWAEQAIQAGAPWVVKGFLDDRPEILRGYRYPPILSSVEDYEPRAGDVVLSAIGEPEEKVRYCELLEGRGAQVATLIHTTPLRGPGVVIGAGFGA